MLRGGDSNVKKFNTVSRRIFILSDQIILIKAIRSISLSFREEFFFIKLYWYIKNV